MSSFVQDLNHKLRSGHFELDLALKKKELFGNSCDNVDDFRIGLEDPDETSEEYLDEKEAREVDVEKVIKGEEESMESFVKYLFVFV